MADSAQTLTSSVLAKADELFIVAKSAEGLPDLEKALAQEPENPEIWWRIARCYYDLGMASFESLETQREHYKKGWEYAEKAVTRIPDSAEANKWAGALLGRYSDHIPIKEKISYAFKIKTYMEISEKLAPQDPIPIHSLAIWHMQVSSIGWVERNIASLLFAEPPTSTYEKALEYFQKAHDMVKDDPVWAGFLVLNSAENGDCYERMGNKPKAKEMYQQTIDQAEKSKTHGQTAALKKARDRLAALNASWW